LSVVAGGLVEIVGRIRPLLHRFPLLMLLFPVLGGLGDRSLLDLGLLGSRLGRNLSFTRGLRTLGLSALFRGWRR
jgi:hypothetical protein